MTAQNRLFGVIGWKNSGKTTLVERLVAELTRRGRRISTIKHAHHDVDIDEPGRDSHRHREAGAVEVALVGGRRWAVMRELRDEAPPSLGDIAARLAAVDLVIVEGYKTEPFPKLEVRRSGASRDAALAPGDPTILAIACDTAEPGHVGTDETGLPLFHLDDIQTIADFVEETMLIGPQSGEAPRIKTGTADADPG